MSLKTLQVQLYCFLNILCRLLSGVPLGDAAGQRGNFRDKDAVFILFNGRDISCNLLTTSHKTRRSNS